MRRLVVFVVAVLLTATIGMVAPTVGAGAAANGWPRTAVTCVWFSADLIGPTCTPVFANGEIGPAFSSAGMGHLMLAAPIVGGSERLVGRVGVDGWLVGADGGVFSYTAQQGQRTGFFGSMGGKHLNAPIVGMATATEALPGYWLVARDGGIFSFGKVRFHGSMGATNLNAPMVGMAATATGNGYWLVGSDGGVFTFGDARYLGSVPGRGLRVSDVVGIASTPSNKGYWIARADGQVDNFGDANPVGNFRASNDPVVAIASSPRLISGQGYCLVQQSGATLAFGPNYTANGC